MTQFSKIFVLFSTVLSLLFLGVVSVNRAGGINWDSKAVQRSENDPLKNYQFDLSEGETPTYSATNRISEENEGTPSPILAKKIIDVRKAIRIKQASILERQEAEIAVVEREIAESKRLIALDIPAIEKRIVSLSQQLKVMEQKIADAQKLSAEKSDAVLKKQREAEERRLDVYRLRTELDELRTDRFRAEKQLVNLKDVLVRLKGKNILLEDRNQQLRK